MASLKIYRVDSAGKRTDEPVIGVRMDTGLGSNPIIICEEMRMHDEPEPSSMIMAGLYVNLSSRSILVPVGYKLIFEVTE